MTDNDDKVSQTLFIFLSSNLDNLARSEVQDELRSRGIEMSGAYKRISAALETARAKAALEQARNARPSIVQKFQSLVADATGDISQQLKTLIEQRSDATMRPVLMRRLQSAASENDLKSLLDDLKRLNELEKDAGNEGSSKH